MTKRKLKEYRDKYWCVKKQREETWAEFRHRVEVEKEIKRFLRLSTKKTYFGLVPIYNEAYRSEIVTEALIKLSKFALFEPSVIEYHGVPVVERTRILLLAFLHRDDLSVLSDWCIYKPSPHPLELYGVTFTESSRIKKACKYKILWYLSQTRVVLPRDDPRGGGVLRKIVEFII